MYCVNLKRSNSTEEIGWVEEKNPSPTDAVRPARSPRRGIATSSPNHHRRRRLSSPDSGKSLELDAKSVHRIAASWKSIPDKQAFSYSVFENIFKAKPSLRELFQKTKNGEKVSTVENHISKYADFWDMLVASLETGTTTVFMLRNVGRIHFLNKRVTFDAENWLLFKAGFLRAIRQHCSTYSDKVDNSWQLLVMFVIAEIKHAFNSETIKTSSQTLSAVTTPEHKGYA